MSRLLAKLRFAWSRRGLAVWVAAMGIIVTVMATVAMYRRDRTLEKDRFVLLAGERVKAIQAELRQPTQVLPILAKSVTAGDSQDAQAFIEKATPVLESYPQVNAVVQVPAESLREAELSSSGWPAAWPQVTRGSHPGKLPLHELINRLRQASRQNARASSSPGQPSILLLWQGNHDSKRSEWAERSPSAQDSGTQVRVDDVPGDLQQIVVGYPLDHPANSDGSSAWLLLEINVAASMAHALERFSQAPIALALESPGQVTEGAARTRSARTRSGLALRSELNLLGESWYVNAIAPTGSLSPHRPFNFWFNLLGGLFTTAAVTAYVASIVGRAARIEQVVDDRTRELREANQLLSQEITVRKHVESRLSEYAAQLELSNRELQQAREEMSHTLIELRERNQELDEFNYIASHDLQEPVRKMISFSTLLKQDLGKDLAETVQQDLHYIIEAAYRMKDLIHDLLAFSRAGREAMKFEAVPLQECVRTAIDALLLSIEESGAEVRYADLPQVTGDRTLLAQLFQNLLGNAIKFCERPVPTIEIDAVEKDGMCVVSVRDNGVGIREKYRERIFQPFQRLHGKAKYPGNGIGLAICRKTVVRHGGKLWVESEPGEGSTFFFTLPLHTEDETQQQPGDNLSLENPSLEILSLEKASIKQSLDEETQAFAAFRRSGLRDRASELEDEEAERSSGDSSKASDRT